MSIWKGIKLNSTNAKGFLLFLLLTTIIAALTKLSKKYEVHRSLTVRVTELPLDRTVSSISPQKLEVSAETSGFSVIRTSFDSQELEISFDELAANGKGTYSFETTEHQTIIQRAIANDATLINIKPKVLNITVDSLSSKRVVVIPRINIAYAIGFNAASAVSVRPDSITIVGPSQILDRIKLLQTKMVSASDANESIKELVVIDTDSLSDILKYSQVEIMVEQAITRFTEGTVTVPITVLNDPSDRLKILPKNVKIVYKVALESFENIGSSDFQVTCDYNNAKPTNEYLSLKIERQPSIAQDARLSTKQVKFIVIN